MDGERSQKNPCCHHALMMMMIEDIRNLKLMVKVFLLILCQIKPTAQLAVAVEYANSISAEG